MGQEDITILSAYALNTRAYNYMRQKIMEFQKEVVGFAIIVGEPSIRNGQISRQKISKTMVKFNNTIN